MLRSGKANEETMDTAWEAMRLLGGEEGQTSVKFVKLPSPHPQPAPGLALPMGEGGRSDGGRGGRVRGPWPIEPHSSAV